MTIQGGKPGAGLNLDEEEANARRLYDLILRTSNAFLHNCKGFSVDILALERPTYTEVAEIMRKVGKLVLVLSDRDDPMRGQKAFEYCELMDRIGTAIDNNDQAALDHWVRELERRPGV